MSKYDGEDDHLNVKGAARRLGVSPHTMRALLRKLAITPVDCDQRRGHRLSEEQLAIVQTYIQEAFDPEDAANRLGCTPQDLKSMVARKLLQPAFCMTGRNHFTREELDAFVDEISSASLNDPSLDGTLIATFCGEAGISLAEATSRIIRDRSLVIVEHNSGLPLFDGLMVACAPDSTRRASVRPNAQVRDAITYAEAAARLGTKHEGIMGLVEASFIKTAKDSRNKDRICRESLDLFECRYVKAAAYAPILGCPPTTALKILRTKGVVPINDWKSAGQRFVDRDEVMRLTGLACPKVVASAEWQSIKVELDEHLVAQAVPATTRISSEPAIEVRATTGRWSLLIKRDQTRGQYSLISNFTHIRQRGRLRKVEEASIKPGEIWPGARVHDADGGGFVIVDDAIDADPRGLSANVLIGRVITRAYQLHQIL